MAKKIEGYIKLQIEAGKANPAPPVGPALGQHGVNIMDFCKQFNAKTQDQPGMVIPVVITVYADRSFTFITKTPPAAVLLKKAAGIQKASGVPNKTKVASVTKAQAGLTIPVVITVFEDRSFTFITKTPPAAVLLKKAAGLEKASGEPNKNKVATVTLEQVQEIAKTKMPDLNAASLEAATSMIKGTARSMGIVVEE